MSEDELRLSNENAEGGEESATPPVSEQPTRRFAASSEAQTALQNAPDTEPTKTFSKDRELKDLPNENALSPSRVRFLLVCLLFVNMFVVAGVITVFDYGVLSTEGAFLVMEFFRGNSLRQILEREGKLEAQKIVAWFAQVLDGVEAAHEQGIIHRDLKPDNILVSQSADGAARVCILDFGLARLNEQGLGAQSVTVPGTVMGTFGYMSPEQLRGERTDERSDLFAVGVMIYEALYGERPFRGKNYQELLRAMEILPRLDGDLKDFFAKSLAEQPSARFASAAEMKRVLLASGNAVSTTTQ